MLLRLPWMLHADVFQEESLFHHIQSEEPVTSLTFLLDIEVHCRLSSESQSGINPSSLYSGNTTLCPEVGTFCVSFRQLDSAKAHGSRLHYFSLKLSACSYGDLIKIIIMHKLRARNFTFLIRLWIYLSWALCTWTAFMSLEGGLWKANSRE